MSQKIFVISADNLGLSRDQVDYPDLELLRFPVFVGDKEYRQDEVHNAKWLLQKYTNEQVVAKSSTLVKQEMVDIVERVRSSYDMIVQVVMGSGMSSASFVVAENVRKMYEGIIPIVNVDSSQVINGVGNVLLGVIDLIKSNRNLSPEEIAQKSKDVVQNTFTYFIFPDLNYLYRGGRIGKAKSLVGTIMKIIPIIGMLGDNGEGVMVPVGKGRTFKQVNTQLVELIKAKMAEKSASTIKRMNLTHFGGNDEAVAELKEMVGKLPCNDFIIGTPNLVEAVYAGPGAYCLSMSL